MARLEETYRGFKLVVQTWKGVLQGCAWDNNQKKFTATGRSRDEILASLKNQIGTATAQIPPPTKREYVATANSVSRIFHRPQCTWMSGVTYTNEIKFDSKNAALKKGYSRCHTCRP
jgi:hypothetical protein